MPACLTEISQGRLTFPDAYSKELRIRPSAVITLKETLPAETYIFVDRYFTIIRLLEFLFAKEIVVKGTVMKSRVPAATYLTHESVMEKMPKF